MQIVCLNCGKPNRVTPERLEPGISCERCRKALLKPDATGVTDEQLRSSIRDDELPLLVDFWAPWCKPCRSMAASVSATARKTVGQYRILKLNTDEYPKTANRHHVKSLPTLVLFRRRKEIARITGVKTQKQILQWLENST